MYSFDLKSEAFPRYSEDGELLEMEQFEYLESEVNRNAPEYIRWVQNSLNKVLGLKLAVDGKIGPPPRSAIRSFQQRQGLGVDGIVGPKTEAALKVALGGQGLPQTTPPLPGGDVSATGGRPKVLDRFEYKKDTLQPFHRVQIARIAQTIVTSQRSSQPIRSVRIAGHTDPAGPDWYNMQLGQRRAEQVRKNLVREIETAQTGLSRKINIEVASLGERQPTGKGAEKDRRVEIFLTPSASNLAWQEVLSGGRAGNKVTALIRGPDTFKAMTDAIKTANTSGHYIYLIAWHLTDNLILDPGDPRSSIRNLFADKSNRGVQIRALIWDDVSWTQNDTAVNNINRLKTGAAILDNNTLLAGAHHQKILIVKGDQGLITFCGGVDINPDRVTTVPSTSPCPPDAPGGSPLHDVHCKIEGPAAFDLLNIFVRRWIAHPDHQRYDRARGPLLGICESVPTPQGSQYVKIATTFN